MARRRGTNGLDDDLGVGSSSQRPSERAARQNTYRDDVYEVPVRKERSLSMQETKTTQERVYVIRSISENDLTNYSFFRKLSDGIPVFCNYRYTMTLVNMDGAAHGRQGENLNAVIWGKIEDANIEIQDRVQVKGKRRGGRFVVSHLYDYDAQEHIRINRHWRTADPNRGNSSSGRGLFWIIGIIALLLLIILLFGDKIWASIPPAVITKFKIIMGVIVILAYLFITKFQILRTKLGQTIFGVLALAFLWKVVPGGDSIIVVALILFGMFMLLKSILK